MEETLPTAARPSAKAGAPSPADLARAMALQKVSPQEQGPAQARLSLPASHWGRRYTTKRGSKVVGTYPGKRGSDADFSGQGCAKQAKFAECWAGARRPAGQAKISDFLS